MSFDKKNTRKTIFIEIGVYIMMTTKINFALNTNTHTNLCDGQFQNKWAN